MAAAELERLVELARARRGLPEPDECLAIRVEAELSRAEIAEAIGVSSRAVAQWERGERRPRGRNCERYFAVLRAIRSLEIKL